MAKDIPLSHAARTLYLAVLGAGRTGITHSAFLSANRGLSSDELQSAINSELLSNGLIDVVVADGTVYYRGVFVHGVPPARASSQILDEYARHAAQTIMAFDANDRAVFHCVRQSGDLGIWTRDIRTRTGLHQNVMTKAVRSLEHRQIIKAVRSVKHPSRKMYMLWHLEPSVQLTGGPWFNDNELDVVFIEVMRKLCYRFIMSRSVSAQEAAIINPLISADEEDSAETIRNTATNAAPLESVERREIVPFSLPEIDAEDLPILPATYSEYPTAADVYRYVTQSGVVRISAAIGPGDVATVVRCLMYDGLVERFVPRYAPASSRTRAKRQRSLAHSATEDSAADDDDENDSLETDEHGNVYVYRAVRPSAPPSAIAALFRPSTVL